jgi:hypothetical protein
MQLACKFVNRRLLRLSDLYSSRLQSSVFFSLLANLFFIVSKMPVIKSEKQSKRVSAGRCPHCRLLFRNPLTLTCGHSLCASCCQELLERRSDSETSDNEKTQPTMRTPVMGSRIMSEFNASLTPKRFSMAIRAPECPVCGNAPSYVGVFLITFKICNLFSKLQLRTTL